MLEEDKDKVIDAVLKGDEFSEIVVETLSEISDILFANQERLTKKLTQGIEDENMWRATACVNSSYISLVIINLARGFISNLDGNMKPEGINLIIRQMILDLLKTRDIPISFLYDN